MYSIKVWIGLDALFSAPVILSSGDYHTELAFRDMSPQRRLPYGACFPRNYSSAETFAAGGKPSNKLLPGERVKQLGLPECRTNRKTKT